MVHVITFSTTKFDPAAEPPNPINPIAGESVLRWLNGRLVEAGCEASAPEVEDWGWYVYVQHAEGRYLVGASGEPEDGGAPVARTLQVHRHRSLGDRLSGRNKMRADDPLAALIERLLKAEPAVTGVQVDRDA